MSQIWGSCASLRFGNRRTLYRISLARLRDYRGIFVIQRTFRYLHMTGQNSQRILHVQTSLDQLGLQFRRGTDQMRVGSFFVGKDRVLADHWNVTVSPRYERNYASIIGRRPGRKYQPPGFFGMVVSLPEIYGSNLSATSRTWAASDFNGANAPTTLDGVTVTINGQLAFVNYVSPGQVDVIVPGNLATDGVALLTPSNSSGVTSPYPINVAPLQPGLLAPPSFVINGKQYVAALFPDGTFVLPAGALPGVASRPAKPGETITFYGIGFGPVIADTPVGTIAQQQNTLQDPLQILFGQTPATLSYDGLAPTSVGLYQFNLVVPPVSVSEAVPLTFNLGRVQLHHVIQKTDDTGSRGTSGLFAKIMTFIGLFRPSWRTPTHETCLSSSSPLKSS